MNLNVLQKTFFNVCKRPGLSRNKVLLLIDYKYDEKLGVQYKKIQMPLFNLRVFPHKNNENISFFIVL